VSELKKQIEAILFAAGKKVTYEDLARLCNTDISAIKNEIQVLKKGYEEMDSPLILTEEADGWKMTVREKYLSLVHKMLPETELSKSVLETLAVIAWKHPVLQSEVIKIRTNKAYEHIEELVERGFISKEKKGRSYLLKVTPKFNEYFELPNNEAIKKVFEDIQKHIKLEETEQEEEEHLGKLEVFEEEPIEEGKKPKIEFYDGKPQEAEEQPEEEAGEPEEKEEVEESSGENEEIEEKIKQIEKTKNEMAEAAEEIPEEEVPEEPEKKEEAEKKPAKKKKEGRELSPELEALAESNEEEEEK